MPIVFGLGSGRCGTMSLQSLINAQAASVCFHEMNPSCMAWSGSEMTVLSLLADFTSALEGGARLATIDLCSPQQHGNPVKRYQEMSHLSVVGDVALYYLPYVELIISTGKDVRFPCLQRNKQDTIASFVAKLHDGNTHPLRRYQSKHYRNHWVPNQNKKWKRDYKWDKLFPKVAGDDTSLADAIGSYWEYYYAEAARLEKKFPELFRIFPISCLNHADGQKEILDFCGMQSPHVTQTFHRNSLICAPSTPRSRDDGHPDPSGFLAHD